MFDRTNSPISPLVARRVHKAIALIKCMLSLQNSVLKLLSRACLMYKNLSPLSALSVIAPSVHSELVVLSRPVQMITDNLFSNPGQTRVCGNQVPRRVTSSEDYARTQIGSETEAAGSAHPASCRVARRSAGAGTARHPGLWNGLLHGG